MPERPWRVAPGGLLLTVRHTPRGGRGGIDGVQQLADGTNALKARVRAPASEGEANAARLKQVRISGAVPGLAAALEKICAIS